MATRGGMFRSLFERTRPAEQRSYIGARSAGDVGHLHPAGGDRPGLVEHDGVDLPRRLERPVALEEDPRPRPLPGGHVQRSRGGEAQRTRAGDDQDGESRRERLHRRVPEPEPRRQGRQRDQEDGRDEDVADAVGQSLHRSLLVLGVLDQSEHLRQLGVSAHLGGAHHQATARRDGPPHHGVARRHIERQRLAGQDAPVHRRLSEDDLAVGGDRLPGPDDEPVTDSERRHRAAPLEPAGVDHAHVLGSDRRQCPECVARPLPGPRFEVASGQHEGRDPGRHIEVDGTGRAVRQHEEHGVRYVAGVAPEHRVHRPHGGGHDAQRHQRVHRRQTVPCRTHRRPVEGPRRPGHHRCRQGQHQPLPAGEPQVGRHGEGDRHVAQGHEEQRPTRRGGGAGPAPEPPCPPRRPPRAA